MQRRKKRYLRTDFSPLWSMHSRFFPDLFDGEPQPEGLLRYVRLLTNFLLWRTDWPIKWVFDKMAY